MAILRIEDIRNACSINFAKETCSVYVAKGVLPHIFAKSSQWNLAEEAAGWRNCYIFYDYCWYKQEVSRGETYYGWEGGELVLPDQKGATEVVPDGRRFQWLINISFPNIVEGGGGVLFTNFRNNLP
jgi:hypothetical protein